MAFEEYRRKDSFTRDSVPKISIRKEHIGFNANFVKTAELQNFSKVKLLVDREDFRVGFRFGNENDSNALALFSDNPTHTTKAISASQIFKEYPFIRSISQLQDTLARQFEIKQDHQHKGLWIAQLCPAFEHTASSMSDLKNLRGIYRYRRDSGEVVYIGRGSIHSRLSAVGRKEWDFDVIEYSVIEDPIEQAKWESYWLNRFVEREGKLPIHNKLKGLG